MLGNYYYYLVEKISSTPTLINPLKSSISDASSSLRGGDLPL